MRKKCSTVSFKSQVIYCGIDVHKKSWKVCIRHCGIRKSDREWQTGTGESGSEESDETEGAADRQHYKNQKPDDPQLFVLCRRGTASGDPFGTRLSEAFEPGYETVQTQGPAQFLCWVGPHLGESGQNEEVKSGGNRKKKQLHYQLIESDWRAVRFNREYSAKYGAMIGKGICPQKAISIVAKKLLLSIRAVWLQNREYQVLLPKTKWSELIGLWSVLLIEQKDWFL